MTSIGSGPRFGGLITTPQPSPGGRDTDKAALLRALEAESTTSGTGGSSSKVHKSRFQPGVTLVDDEGSTFVPAEAVPTLPRTLEEIAGKSFYIADVKGRLTRSDGGTADTIQIIIDPEGYVQGWSLQA